jgi:16S rRNA (cytidine1402-2'-O)-methyltransferase
MSLFVCGTPLGNLEDICLRAIRILKEVDLIACEDTRHSKILLDHYQIKIPTTSFHQFTSSSKVNDLIRQMKDGKNVALITDAGMPGISDPGHALIKKAIEEAIDVIPIPGPTALTTALSVSGLITDKFVFIGFLPAKHADRIKALTELVHEEKTLVFYEAPHRIDQTLEDMMTVLGNRKVCLARELTKKFEEISRGDLKQVISRSKEVEPRGEYTLIVEGGQKEQMDEKRIMDFMKELASAQLSKKQLAQLAARHFGLSKNKVYDILVGK